MNIKIRKLKFYILSCTWGLPMTFIGALAALILCAAGYKPQKWGYCYYFEVGDNWGGCELGMFFLKSKTDSTYIKNHEHGHAIQNCYFGFLMPFIVCIPSAIRYWYREYLIRVKKAAELCPYDDIWFEGQATQLGTEFIKWLNSIK